MRRDRNQIGPNSDIASFSATTIITGDASSCLASTLPAHLYSYPGAALLTVLTMVPRFITAWDGGEEGVGEYMRCGDPVCPNFVSVMSVGRDEIGRVA